MTKLDRRLKSSPHCGSPIEPSWWYGHPRVPVPISTALLIQKQTISARGPAGLCYLSVRLCFALGKRTAESPGGRTNSIRGSRDMILVETCFLFTTLTSFRAGGNWKKCEMETLDVTKRVFLLLYATPEPPLKIHYFLVHCFLFYI